MRARSTIVSMICATTLIIAGCSTGISGSPELPGAASDGGSASSAGSVNAGSGSAGSVSAGSESAGSASAGSGSAGSDSAGSDSAPQTNAPQTDEGDDGSGRSSSGDGIPGLPSGLPSLPSGLSGLPTDLGSLGSLPGFDTGCLTAAGILISIPVLFLGPSLGGQPLTKKDVDQAFSDLGDVPSELKQPLQVLHDAATQAIGKSADQASTILNSDKVNDALDAINSYTDKKCGGS